MPKIVVQFTCSFRGNSFIVLSLILDDAIVVTLAMLLRLINCCVIIIIIIIIIVIIKAHAVEVVLFINRPK